VLDLAAETDRLLDFATASRHPEGGFAWLNDDGTADLERPRELWITTRMTHCFALGHLLGRPGAAELVDHGIAALTGVFHDSKHGGWFTQVGGATDKRAYDHVFVVLAASSAVAAGRPADALLAEALGVLDARFWDEDAGALVDVWNRDWSELEPYRGANANMHGVEAMLAVGWRERALRVTERLVHRNLPRINEHFDPDWRPLPDYHRDEPAHPFRPYGATIGHWFEWARLCLHLRAALDDPPGWLERDARALFARAVAEGWVDGGFVYTVDWDGTPVVRDHLQWVLCEAIGAAAVLGEDALQREWWEHAERCYVDREHGGWHMGLDERNRPSSHVWQGKPDVYHALQATLIPRLPPAPSLAESARQAVQPPGSTPPGIGAAGS
jgi:mannose/cellobiose epimerase-like protein (N-acyl-D-glucosamine 2-epimerase family)